MSPLFPAPRDARPAGAFPSGPALLFVTFLWGMNFVALRLAMAVFTPFVFRTILYTLSIAALLGAALWWRIPLRVPLRRDRLHLVGSGLFSCGGFGLLASLGVVHAEAGRTAICIYTMPVWVALLSHVVLKDRITRAQAAATGLCIAGLGVLLAPIWGTSALFGAAISVAGGMVWAVGIVYLKWADVSAHPMTITIYQLGAGLAVSLAGLPLMPEPTHGPVTAAAVAALAYCILFATIITYPLWYAVLDRLSATTTGLGALLVPVFGLGGSMLFLGERPTSADYTGFGLILGAAVIALACARKDKEGATGAPS